MDNQKKAAACTIVSKNYIAYARTLCASYLKHHPDNDFFVLLVDKNNGEIDVSKELFKLITVEELPIADFKSITFRFDVLELNTNVKPAFLQYLFNQHKIYKIIYFDPDIYIYQPVTMIYSLLEDNNVVLTPHCTEPINDTLRPNERDFLKAGVFNLGFIALQNSDESNKLLTWWGNRCLTLGYNETQSGLFVDQKWMNFAPCFVDKLYVLKHAGCNMAYWNLHERSLTKVNSEWIVNNKTPLLFFHFSGVDINNQDVVSKYQNRSTFDNRSDLREIFGEYFMRLEGNEIRETRQYNYAFGTYSNGEKITSIARRIFSIKAEFHQGEDPFLVDSQFYKWAKQNQLLSTNDDSGKFNSNNYQKNDWRIRIINRGLKLTLKMFGADKYSMLMKYFSYISIFRNQRDLF